MNESGSQIKIDTDRKKGVSSRESNHIPFTR